MTTTAQDREANIRLLQQRPDLGHLLTKPTTACTYDGTPSAVVRTGRLGNRYGLCADCRDAQDRTDDEAKGFALTETPGGHQPAIKETA